MSEYYYRRKLGAKDLLPAVGVGVAAGLAVTYLVQLLIQRTPLASSAQIAAGTEKSAGTLTSKSGTAEGELTGALPPGRTSVARLSAG